MPAGAIEIREITGDERSIVLRGRALPYRGTSWEGSQRSVRKFYAGNAVATLQILGPEEMPTTMEGTWKDRYLLNAADGETVATLEGFDLTRGTPGTAQELVEAFTALRREGNTVRVEWGSQIRTGILKRFRADYDREEDVRWEAEWEWASMNDEVAPRAAAPPESVFSLLSAINALGDIPIPDGLEPDFLATVLGAISDLEGAVTGLLQDLSDAAALVEAPGLILGRIASAVENIRTQCEELLSRLSETAGQFARTADDPATILISEQWRGLEKAAVFDLRRRVQETGRDAEARFRPRSSRFVTVPAATSLMVLSQRLYGTPDEWQFLADVNGLPTSIAPEGFQLFVPPRPAR